MDDIPTPSTTNEAAIWHGFHHAWTYNHRLNRLGSFVTEVAATGGASHPCVVHTAASGTGGDSADVADYATVIRDAQGVTFLSGVAETQVECQRGDSQPFVIRIDELPLPPEMQNRDVLAAVINGFDLIAAEHSEKLMTMDVEITDPVLTSGGTHARFRVLGQLCFDCRSPECQLLPFRLAIERISVSEGEACEASNDPDHDPYASEERTKKRGIDRHRIDRAAHWLKQRLVKLTDVEGIKQSIVGDEGDILRRKLFRVFDRRILFKFLKWRFSAPYKLRVHYLLIAGDRDALSITESRDFGNRFGWGLDSEIEARSCGQISVHVEGDDPAAYAVNTLAFKRFATSVIIDEEQGSEDPIQWGKGMHLLEWNVAVHDLTPTTRGINAKLDLFYKNWSEAMNEVLTLTTWGAVRAAGTAEMSARLALIQLRDALGGEQRRLPGRIRWPGGGLSAEDDPRAQCTRTLAIQSGGGP